MKLKTAIEKALTKMKKYYVQTEDKSDLLYNIVTVLNTKTFTVSDTFSTDLFNAYF